MLFRSTDVVIQVRYAAAMNATGDHLKARRLLESVIGSRSVMPEMIRATAFAEYASALERSNERTRAIEYYERALSASGGDPRAYTRARDALARLRA